MQLYFIAVVPPKGLADSITEIKKDFALHYTSSRALKSPPHITLRPPFKMFQQREAELISSLNNFALNRSPFTVKLNGYGHFRSDVVFIKPDSNEALNNLYLSLEAWLINNNNFSPMQQYPSFHPHITVAYKDLSRTAFLKAWEVFENKAFEAMFEVNEIYLLKHLKQKWEVINEFSFSAKP